MIAIIITHHNVHNAHNVYTYIYIYICIFKARAAGAVRIRRSLGAAAAGAGVHARSFFRSLQSMVGVATMVNKWL